MFCRKNGNCMYNPKWFTGINFCVRPCCPYASAGKQKKEGKKNKR